MAAIQLRSAAPFSKNRCKSPFNIEIWERENGDISLVVSSSSSRAAADEKVSLDSDVSARYKIDGWNRSGWRRRPWPRPWRGGLEPHLSLGLRTPSLSDERTEKGP